jgi:hypothetical protein
MVLGILGAKAKRETGKGRGLMEARNLPPTLRKS